MTKSKVWISLAAGGALAIALTSAAFAAELSDNSFDATSPAAAGVANASLPDHASSVATAVLAALTGGSNPSAVASAKGQAASEQASNENATTESEQNEAADNDKEAGHEASPAGTTSTKPGWGCGDTNHTHSGPPGNPGASSPCNKH